MIINIISIFLHETCSTRIVQVGPLRFIEKVVTSKWTMSAYISLGNHSCNIGKQHISSNCTRGDNTCQ